MRLVKLSRSVMRRVRPVAPALAAAALAGVAGADVVVNYVNPQNYDVRITYMPDLDQQRNGLPNTGNMYCVPTAAVNLTAYLGRHGYPQVFTGSQSMQWWQNDLNHSAATANLLVAGVLAGTDPFDGTNGSGGLNALQGMIPNGFLIFRFRADGTYAPRFEDVANWMAFGALVNPCVGWYEQALPFIARDGGHCLTATRATRNGSTKLIGWRDPGSDEDDLNAQSDFSTESYAIETRAVTVLPSFDTRLMDKIVDYGSAYLDGLYVVLPPYGLTPTPSGDKFNRFRRFNLPGIGGGTEEVETGVSAGIRASVLASHRPSVYWINDREPGIPTSAWELDLVTGESTLLREFGNARAVALGPDLRLYVIDENVIRCLDVSGEEAVETASVTPPFPPLALAFDDATGDVVALASSRYMRFDGDLALQASRRIPPSVDLVGTPIVAVNPATGNSFIASTAGNGVFEVVPSGAFELEVVSSINDDIAVELGGLSIGDDGNLVLTRQGALAEFGWVPELKIWREVLDSPYRGVPSGGGVQLACSRTNIDPADDDDPIWRNVLPTEFAAPTFDCVGDLDGNLVVDAADLATLLGEWNSPGNLSQSDLNGDGAVDAADLAVLLGAWGPCP